MKTVTIPIKEPFVKGLSPKNNKRNNNPYLTESKGAFPYQDALQSIEQITQLNTSSLGCTFPYPQLIITSNVILVCTPTAIYEVIGNSLILKIQDLTAGLTWSVIDSKEYLYLTNGYISVERNPFTKEYATNTNIPAGSALCNYNGQVIVAYPTLTGGWGLFPWGNLNWPN
jgi:hypothetical protein